MRRRRKTRISRRAAAAGERATTPPLTRATWRPATLAARAAAQSTATGAPTTSPRHRGPPESQVRIRMDFCQGVTKRCRLSWLTNSALVYERKCGGGGRGVVAGSQPRSPNKNLEI
jgi:hypothetical protein